MPEVIVGLACLAFFCLGLIGIGFAIGRASSGSSRPPSEGPPSPERDLQATARTLRLLWESGLVDDDLKVRLISILREAQSRLDTTRRPYRTTTLPLPQETRAAAPPAPTVAKDVHFIGDVASEAAVKAVPVYVAEAPAEPPHPLDAPDVQPLPPVASAPSAPQRRRRALADVLQSFLQEKNIRWGEIVSGVLIVGCSIALAISLRREIASLSDRFIYLPALLFMLATAAVHGAGNYTLRRWKLKSTSRGALIIASLLIPINFLASIVVTGPESRALPLFHPLYLSAIAVGVVAFGTMAYFAGTALMRGGWWRLWIVLMGTSIGQLIVSRTEAFQSDPLAVWAIVALPLAAYLVATISQLRIAVRRPRMTPSVASETLLLLGVATFSLAAPIGLLIFEAESTREALANLSAPLCATAIIVLATGLALYRRCVGKTQGPLRVVGVSLALLGGVATFAATAAAWPDPELLVAVGLIGFLGLTALAIAGRLPALHVPALACVSLACLVGVYLLQRSFDGFEDALSHRLVELLLNGRSAAILAVLGIVVGGAGAGLLVRRRRETGLSYLVASGGLAVVSLAIALGIGFLRDPAYDPDFVTPILLFYAGVGFIAAWAMPVDVAKLPWLRPAMTSFASSLAQAGVIHGLDWNVTIMDWLADLSLLPERRVVTGSLLYGFAATLAAALVSLRMRKDSFSRPQLHWRGFVVPLALSGLSASVMTSPWAIYVVGQRFGDHAMYVAAIAVIWLGGAIALRSRSAFMIFQSVATASVVLAATAVCQTQSWWAGDLLDPRHLQVQLAALSVWCLAWTAGRSLARPRFNGIVRRMRLPEFAIDEVVLGIVLFAFAGLSVAACLPGIAQESSFLWRSKLLDVERAQAFLSGGSWIALALILAAVVGALIERRTLPKASALFLIAGSGAALIAGFGYVDVSVASTLRWSFAGLGTFLTIVLFAASRFEATLGRILPRRGPRIAAYEALGRSWTLALTAVPVIGLTTLSLVQAARGVAPSGPLAESIFARMGSELSFGVPLALLVVVFVAHALRARSPYLMVAGSLTFQYLVNLGYFLPILKNPDLVWDWSVAIGCLQWNAIGLAAFAIAWLGRRRLTEPREAPLRVLGCEPCLAVQVLVAVGAAVAISALAVGATIVRPHDVAAFSTLGEWPSFAACVSAFGALGWILGRRLDALTISAGLGFFVALSGPLAIAAEAALGSWGASHVLTIVWIVVAAVAVGLSWFLRAPRTDSSARVAAIAWASCLLAGMVALTLRGAPFDPESPWHSFGALAAATGIATALALRTRLHSFAFASAFTACAAINVVWAYVWPAGGLQGALDLLQLNVLAAVALSAVWLIAEIRQQARFGRPFFRFARFPAVHAFAAVATVAAALLIGLIGAGIFGVLAIPRNDSDVSNIWAWLALAASGALTIGCLWDARMKIALPTLYVWGVAAILLAIDFADARATFDGRTVFVIVGFAVATFVALTGRLWQQGAELAAFGTRLGMPDAIGHLRRTALWLPVVTVLIALASTTGDSLIVLTFPERWMRVAAACGPALLAFGIGCLAQQDRRTTMQYGSLILASYAALLVGWADIAPEWHEALILERVVRLLVVFAALALAYAIPVARLAQWRGGDWLPVVDRMANFCGFAAIGALAATLALEIAYFVPGVGVPFGHPYQFAAVAVVSVGLIVALVAMALSPRLDRLSLPDKGREAYVYAAEVVAAGLFAHIYLSFPQIFGALREYWPYIVMAVAFAGVGAGEILKRGGVKILADPLQRTGYALPLLPAIGWWLNPAFGIETAGHYALLLFFAGLIYATLSLMRGSYLSGIAAAIACNGALWALLADHDALSILKHPQTWLIPPALTTVVAAQLLRRQLTDVQHSAVRYLCLIVIYVSSTADVFIGGVGDSLWEPMALATLSVIGVFVGIALQIRAFLYLGSTFTFLAVVSMVWHAYDNIGHVGIWWAFGIVLGAMILVIFGVFEKYRAELTRLAQAMRSWEP